MQNDDTLSNSGQIVSLSPLPNTRGAAVVGDICYCVFAITSHLYEQAFVLCVIANYDF